MKPRKLLIILVILVLVVFVGLSSTLADIPYKINYQGKLTNPDGTNVPDSTYSMTFKIYDACVAGNLKWEETQSVNVNNGIFSVLLGEVYPIDPAVVPFDIPYCLEIIVEGETISPRREMVSVGYSFRSKYSDKLDGKDASDFADAVHDHNDLYYTETELNTSDGNPPNQGSNRVSWNNLKDVPSGFADGVDDTGGTPSDTAKYAWNADSLDGHNWGDIYPNADNADKVDGYHYSSTWPTTLGNIKAACSNDFHNIGGTDDDVPDGDAEVPDNISINNGRLYAPSGSGNVGIGTTSPASKLTVQGSVRVNTPGGAKSAEIFTSSNVGIMATHGANGNLNARLNYITGYDNHGHIGVYDGSGTRRLGLYVNSVGGGQIHADGPNGNTNTYLGYLTSYPNNGYVGALDASDNWKAAIYVNSAGQGVVWGDVKSFSVTNPNQPGTEIWYACPEGPEAAAYVRGTGHLTKGKAEIILPEHFVAVASPQGITVFLTPLSGESKGLAVIEKALNRFVVRELANGDGNYDFDYMVMAVRKGHEDYQVIRSPLEAKPAEAELSAEEDIKK